MIGTLVVLLAAAASAQRPAPASAEPPDTPTAAWVTNGSVDAIASSGSGSVFLGGSFDYVGPLTGSGAAVATTDAAVSLALRSNGTIRAAIADGSGGVYIGGTFTEVSGQPRQNLAHVKADGTLDAAWQPEVNGTVHALVTNGVAVWIGGSFSQVGGVARQNLAQVLLADASVTTFIANTDGAVRALGLFTSTLVVGGDYTTIGGSARRGLSVVGANTAAVLHPVANVEGGAASVRSFAIIGTTIYMGGHFDGIRDALGIFTPRKNLASFDGGALALYPWDPGANAPVNAVTTDGSTIWAGGDFTTTGGASRSRLASYTTAVASANPLNAGFDPSVGSGSGTPTVHALAVSGGRLYVGGAFTTVGAQQRTNLAAVDPATGTPTATWKAAAGGPVHALTPVSTSIYVGGAFTSVGGAYRPNLAEVSLATGAATAWEAPTNGPVRDVAVLSGKLYAAGGFTTVHGQPRARLAALAVSTGALDAWNPGADGTVDALAVAPNQVYAGGAFTAVGGQARAGVARIGTDGLVTAFAPAAAGGSVETLALDPFGETLYVGGSFASLAGAPRASAGAVRTATGAVTDWNPSPDGSVLALAATSGAVYAGGTFTSIGGSARQRLAAVDPVTGAAQAFSADANGTVREIALSPTAVYAAGAFTAIGGSARNRLAGLNGTTGALTAWTPTFAPAPAEAVATVGEKVVGGAAVSVPDVSDRGLYVYDTTTGSGASGTLRCGASAAGAADCLEARFPGPYAWGQLAPGVRSSAEQPLQIITNKTWGLSVATDAADGRFREWDGAAYAASPRTLTHRLQAAATRLGDPVGSPAWSALSSTGSSLVSSASASDCTSIPEVCAPIAVGITLKQEISYVDPPLSGRSYRIALTYDVSQPF